MSFADQLKSFKGLLSKDDGEERVEAAAREAEEARAKQGMYMSIGSGYIRECRVRTDLGPFIFHLSSCIIFDLVSSSWVSLVPHSQGEGQG